LAITDEAELSLSLAQLDAIPLTSERRYLIEEMAPPGLELIVGAVRDAHFGPTVLVGLGGALAEAFQDTVTRLAPLTLMDALEMLDELRAARLLDGWRGSPKLDRIALAKTIVTLGSFLCRHSEIQEFEINPLRVYPFGVLALDALLI
jgi:acetyltransferase